MAPVFKIPLICMAPVFKIPLNFVAPVFKIPLNFVAPVSGTAHTRLIIQATEDVYQTTREKLILAEEKKNENQTVMIDFKNKRKLQTKKAGEVAAKTATPVPSNLLKPPQRF